MSDIQPGSGGGTPASRAAARHVVALVGITASRDDGPYIGMGDYITSLSEAEKELALSAAAGLLYSALVELMKETGGSLAHWLTAVGMAAAEPT